MDRFEAMAMLVAVADAGTFSAAARAIEVPLPTLSRKISELESIIGSRLLVRTTRKITFTDAGAIYVANARRILEQVEQAEREAAGEFTTPKGELVLTAPLQFGRQCVLPVVAAFLASFPDINIRLMLADRTLDLVDAHVDMAVRIGDLPDSSMVATHLGQMRMVTCASPRVLDGHGVPRSPAALLDLPTVCPETGFFASAWRFRDPRKGHLIDVTVMPRLRVSTTEAAADAAVAHVGVARLLHYQVADAVRAGHLRLVLCDYEPDPIPVHLVHVSRGQMPVKLRRFIDFAAPRLRSALQALSGASPVGESALTVVDQSPRSDSDG